MNDLVPVTPTEPSTELRITPERRRVVEKAIAKGQVTYLSPDKEGGPFMLFLLGNSPELISEKTSYPLDVILATAIQYQWQEKVKEVTNIAITEQPNVSVVKKIKTDLINSILLATYKRDMKELGDIIAGRKDAKNSKLLPANLHGLEKLINMVTADTEPEKSAQAAGSTLIQGQNVQVIQNAPPMGHRVGKEEKEQMLELLEGDVGE
jgi:hypothetical protein